MLAAAAPDLSRLPPAANRPVDYATDVRPILQANCYGCHGPEKQKSDLRLDTKAAALAGGQRGPVIVPGRSAESPMILFTAGFVEDMQMPPMKGGAKRLTSEEIGVLRSWIDGGAHWPEGADASTAELSSASSRASMAAKTNWWAFQPAVRPLPPKIGDRPWCRNEIDGFIVDRLDREGLAPSPEADRRTLLRRVSFDLTGLPPAPEEVERFLTDNRVDAYEQLVDRLLDSPRYGERWARYWLDTVHYGETHGYDKDKTRPNAWPYRDYVIRAFNQDKAYSRFVQEQLAGDVLFPDDPEGVVALGFIAAGPWDFVGHAELPESKTDGLIARYNDRDDMVMTTMSTFQSLTVHCARCHDHKFDPITQEDYYSLQAVFAGVDRADRWFDSDAKVFQKRKVLLAEKKSLESRQQGLDAWVQGTSPGLFKLIDGRLEEIKKQLVALDKPNSADSPSNGFHTRVAPRRDESKWVQVDLGRSMPLEEIRLVPARPTDFADTPGFGFPVRFKVEIAEDAAFGGPKVLLDQTAADFTNPGDKPVVVPARGQMARTIRVTATRLWERTADYVFALAELQALSGGKNVALSATVTALDSIDEGRWAKAYLVDGFSSRGRLSPAEESVTAAVVTSQRTNLTMELEQITKERQALVERLVDSRTVAEIAEVQTGLDKVKRALGALPAAQKVFAGAHEFAAMGSFKPAAEPRPVQVLRRGEVKQPIHPAEPGAISCLPGLPAKFQLADPKDEGSRRAALAKWLTNPANIQTRRSIVNRVWQNHFGRGLVDSPNDFGHMGAQPTHPELLDWLAFWFLDHNESLKKLHRLILTSATYRQASTQDPKFASIDGDNRYLWRMNRTRLDAESLHDSLLDVAGQLDLTMGGPSVQQFFFKDDHSPVYDYAQFDIESPAARRRSIYRFVVRSVPDPLMETLDCPDPSLLAPKRNTTVTALQALALLNDPLVLRQAEHFANRIAQGRRELPAQIDAAYELALSRHPRREESVRLTAFAQQYGTTNLCRLILNTSEFMFVD